MSKFSLWILVWVVLLTACAGESVDDLKVSQDNLQFIRDNQVKQYTVLPAYQQKLTTQYLKNYFSPWTNPFSFENAESIKNVLTTTVKQYRQNPGWGQNKLPYSQQWIDGIAANIDFDINSVRHRPAITVNETDVRALPTHEPSFTDWTTPGEGYPFDNLQLSHLSANTPIYVLQTSRDGAWQLVITPYNFFGWVQTKDIAYVDSSFIQHWMQKQYLTSVKENIPLQDSQGGFYFTNRLGQIYPLNKFDSDHYQIQVVVADNRRNAVIKTISVAKLDFMPWPLTANTKSIAEFANKFLGQPYGWGGLYGYRDCSATLMDLFAAFGIWLPRSSSNQALQGEVISLLALSDAKKEETIIREGVPFFTLISAPGHIVLYIGVHDGHPYIFHTRWAVPTFKYGTNNNGRSIIGRTAITSLDFGNSYLNSTSTVLDKANRMTLMVPKSVLIAE